MDEELERARQEVIDNDAKGLSPTAVPVGVAAANATEAQHQHIADDVRLAAWRQYTDAAEAEAWPAFKVVETLTQVVAGTNYFFKVRVSAEGSAEEFVHLRVFSSLFGADPELAAMLKGKDGLGPLQYF